MTKTWLEKVDFQFKFNHATPECKQDTKFCAWMDCLNQAILKNPNARGGGDDSKTDTDE